MFISWMLITLSFKKRLLVDQFQGNYLKVAYNCAIGQDVVLFNNKEILIGNQTIFCKEWFQKGIFLI